MRRATMLEARAVNTQVRVIMAGPLSGTTSVGTAADVVGIVIGEGKDTDSHGKEQEDRIKNGGCITYLCMRGL